MGPATRPPPRRHDVDWLRTIAIGFLIVFHIVLSFQSWASSAGLPQNDELLPELVPFVSMLAVWRIPLLFLISGMGVRFAMERRGWKELLKERSIRILLPFLFGTYVLGTLSSVFFPRLGWEGEFVPTFGHLWFLLNIFLYVVWLLSLMVFLKERPDNAFLRFLSKLFRRRWGLLVCTVPLIVEATLVNPEYFSVYVDNVHGWVLGLICFFLGFLFISIQTDFWPAVAEARWISLTVAGLLYLFRLFVLGLEGEVSGITALESMCWMYAIIGFGSLYLNKPSRGLSYLNKAVYPVYIVHLPVQLIIAYYLLPVSAPPYAKLMVLIVGTFGVSLLIYEVVLKRLRWIRPLFGIKLNQA